MSITTIERNTTSSLDYFVRELAIATNNAFRMLNEHERDVIQELSNSIKVDKDIIQNRLPEILYKSGGSFPGAFDKLKEDYPEEEVTELGLRMETKIINSLNSYLLQNLNYGFNNGLEVILEDKQLALAITNAAIESISIEDISDENKHGDVHIGIKGESYVSFRVEIKEGLEKNLDKIYNNIISSGETTARKERSLDELLRDCVSYYDIKSRRIDREPILIYLFPHNGMWASKAVEEVAELMKDDIRSLRQGQTLNFGAVQRLYSRWNKQF